MPAASSRRHVSNTVSTAKVKALEMMNTIRVLSTLGRSIAQHPLTRDGQIQAWSRYLGWQTRCRLQTDVVIPWICGQQLVARRGMTAASANHYFGLYEFPDMALLLHFLREGDLFLDIGSNIGSFAVLASGVCKARTWAFEPDPVTAGRLRRNLEANNLEKLVTVHELALGDTVGTLTFTRSLGSMNRVAKSDEGDVRVVPTSRLDEIVPETERPIMIKMDVEGHEEAVVRGGERMLGGDSVKVIEIETLTDGITSMLQGKGFRLAYYDPWRRHLTTDRIDNQAANMLFVRDWDLVAHRLATAPRIPVLGKMV